MQKVHAFVFFLDDNIDNLQTEDVDGKMSVKRIWQHRPGFPSIVQVKGLPRDVDLKGYLDVLGIEVGEIVRQSKDGERANVVLVDPTGLLIFSL